MAKGGTQQQRQVNNDCSHLLECPICLEQMREPKSLPCLHSFCEECLGTYIVTDLSGEMAAATSFPCPVCRKITSPVDPSDSKETCARQFLTDELVLDLICSKGIADISHFCGPCKKTKNKVTPATSLCKTSDMAFCDLCKVNVHDIFHDVCDIVIIKATNQNLAWNQPLSMTCSSHKEKMDYYCEDHKFIGCYKCIITEHRRCYTVTTTKEIFEKQKNESRLGCMDKSLEKADECLESILKAFDDRVETMQQCQDVGLSSVKSLRERINIYLDKKQDELIDDLNSVYKAEKAKVDLSIQKCSRLKAAIQNTTANSRVATLNEDSIRTIRLFHKGQAELVAYNNFIDEMTYSLKSVSFKHDIGASLSTIDETSILALGEISKEEKSYTIPDGAEYVPNIGLLSECRVRKIRTCRVKLPSDTTNCSPYGVLLLPNDNVIVSDFSSEKLQMFSPDNRCLGALRIGASLREICVVDKDTVAVAGHFKIYIVRVHASKLSLSSEIKLSSDCNCRGIAFVDGVFIVSTPTHIRAVTMEGKSNISYTLGNECRHVAYCPKEEHIFASLVTSIPGRVVLTRLSQWKQADILKDEVVKRAMGVDVDREGNVYVCGQLSNNVVQISPDGTKVRELLTAENDIDKPLGISLCGDKFAITNESAKHRYYVNVFQLY
ncbi:uncharacterized protein LOC117342938 [Pecten maximus]|uniref:uncharacterized protein LOC117342938 n=1 Tax=Pecten maximus TaxID=6579 RepID=UPI001457F2AF|nr:uncharacterized protein LOC117342938 [Pecten maximus]